MPIPDPALRERLAQAGIKADQLSRELQVLAADLAKQNDTTTQGLYVEDQSRKLNTLARVLAGMNRP